MQTPSPKRPVEAHPFFVNPKRRAIDASKRQFDICCGRIREFFEKRYMPDGLFKLVKFPSADDPNHAHAIAYTYTQIQRFETWHWPSRRPNNLRVALVTRWLLHGDFEALEIERNPGSMVHICKGVCFPTIDNLAIRNGWWTITDLCRLECKVMIEVYGAIQSAKGCFVDYTSVMEVAKSSVDASTLPLVLKYVDDHDLLDHLTTMVSDRVYIKTSMQHEKDTANDVTHMLSQSYEVPIQKRIVKSQADVHQKQAILSCLRSPLTVVQGHGGTGKTSMVISTVIRAVLNKGGRCMILSPTNKNIDVQSVSLAERDIKSIRLGGQEAMDLRSRVLLGTVTKATMSNAACLRQWMGLHIADDECQPVDEGRQSLHVSYHSSDAFKRTMKKHNIPRDNNNRAGDYGFDNSRKVWWISDDIVQTRHELCVDLRKYRWLCDDTGAQENGTLPYLVVVDESSMINRKEFRDTIRVCRNAIDDGLRIHLVLMGDACQLLPVENGQGFVDLVAYGRDVGRHAGWFHELEKNYRLCDDTKGLEHLLHAVRRSETSLDHLRGIGGGVSYVKVDDTMSALEHIRETHVAGVTFMAHTNAECLRIHATVRGIRSSITADETRKRILDQGRAVAVVDGKCMLLTIQRHSSDDSTMVGNEVNDENENASASVMCGAKRAGRMVRVPIEDCMHLYDVGDSILFNCSDHKMGVYKGKKGTITALRGRENVMFTVHDTDGIAHSVTCTAKIKPAIAQTVHTAQGSQYDRVVMIAMRSTQFMNNRNMFYTAVSRAKREFTLITDDPDEHIRQSHLVTTRNSIVHERLVDNSRGM